MPRFFSTLFLALLSLPLHAQDRSWVSIAHKGDLTGMKNWLEAGGSLNVRDENESTLIIRPA